MSAWKCDLDWDPFFNLQILYVNEIKVMLQLLLILQRLKLIGDVFKDSFPDAQRAYTHSPTDIKSC